MLPTNGIRFVSMLVFASAFAHGAEPATQPCIEMKGLGILSIQIDDVLPAATQAAKDKSGDASIREFLAEVHFRRGAFDDAERECDAAIGMDSTLPAPHFLKALLAISNGRDELARAELNAGLVFGIPSTHVLRALEPVVTNLPLSDRNAIIGWELAWAHGDKDLAKNIAKGLQWMDGLDADYRKIKPLTESVLVPTHYKDHRFVVEGAIRDRTIGMTFDTGSFEVQIRPQDMKDADCSHCCISGNGLSATCPSACRAPICWASTFSQSSLRNRVAGFKDDADRQRAPQ